MWHSLDLGDGITASATCADITERFATEFIAAGRPPEMAVFIRRTEGSLHCQVIVYFSPACASLARLFDAVSCARPARRGLELLAGDARVWDVLFGDA